MSCCNNCGNDVPFSFWVSHSSKCSNCFGSVPVPKSDIVRRIRPIRSIFPSVSSNHKQLMFGDKQLLIKRDANIKLLELEKRYMNLKSFISADADALRYEIVRLRAVIS